MKISNRTRRTVHVTRVCDGDSGVYTYWLCPGDGGRTRHVCGGSREWLMRCDSPGEFADAARRYSALLEPGATLDVPRAHETYAACAARTGEFGPHLQHRATF